MAEYYALLSRAVGRLQPSNETARREIYTKARNALIQQLKAINPPLSAAEISKQRLELEEAIRKVEREAAVPASTGTTEAEISRSAARAMEEALGPVVDEPPRPPVSPVLRSAPISESVRAEPVTPRAAAPTPAEVRSRAVAAEQADDEDAFAVVTPTPMPSPQPRPTINRAAPRPLAPRAPAQWDERATASAFSDKDAADLADGGRRRGGTRAERRAEREREKPRRSVFSRLLLFILILLVLAGGAYAAYVYREPLQDFFASLTGGDDPETTAEAAAATAEGADATAAAGTPAAAGGNEVRIVGPQPVDAGVGPVNPLGAAEVAEVMATQAILYEDVGDGNLPAYEGTISWTFVNDAEGPRVDVRIDVPERGMQIVLSIQKAPDTAENVSHTIDAIVTVPPDFPGGGIQSIAQLAAKSSEDAVGTAIVAQSLSVPPDYFLLELAAESERQNMSQMRQDWFDLGFVYANGQQAIVTFNKGTEGREVMAQALAAWGE